MTSMADKSFMSFAEVSIVDYERASLKAGFHHFTWETVTVDQGCLQSDPEYWKNFENVCPFIAFRAQA